MSSKGDNKPGFFQKLFGRSKSTSSTGSTSPRAEGPASPRRSASTSDSSAPTSPNKSKPPPSPLLAPPVKTQNVGSNYSTGGHSPSKTANSNAAASGASRKPRRQTSKPRAKSQKHRKRGKTMADPGAIKVDVNKPIEFPTTPEMILAHHKARPFLNRNEEWLLVELNEYECLVDSIDIIKMIAEHSKFFEVEPDELWEEFFEFVDEVPTYDEIINFDVWQEFRDVKYQC